ncbi:MAG: V-type ATP synthase subunit A, partial [Methanomicrobium sp.]|nr:V-type ATP synthase subunit A [Methanomicrobium sp.]
AIMGDVQETNIVTKIMVPPNFKGGNVKEIKKGSFTIDEVVCVLDSGEEVTMMQKWPVRVPRPFIEKKNPDVPLITGLRILDGLFPIAKGGTAAIPGPFGSGKTVTQQSLAKWSDAEIVVYIGCGERGNEMTEVLTEFPELEDPKSGKPLMERTILIANTSNMPVAAREASVYTGITIAEYFRDMGYDVSLMADSTSRWAEAMREISSRLEEMPGEEGYPAYLSARLSEFYERAGRVDALCGKMGSITVIGAVSPPGGDFSEPVTQNTLRIVKCFWALDAKLSQRRHFPAINWLNSYSLYLNSLAPYYDEKVSPELNPLRAWAMEVLQKESELQEIVQLVGSDALPEAEQVTIEIARMLREIFLQQNAYDAVDAYCSMEKQFDLLKAIRKYADLAYNAQKSGFSIAAIIAVKSKNELARLKYLAEYKAELDKIIKEMEAEFAKIKEA